MARDRAWTASSAAVVATGSASDCMASGSLAGNRRRSCAVSVGSASTAGVVVAADATLAMPTVRVRVRADSAANARTGDMWFP
jgi:hypothetical protein